MNVEFSEPRVLLELPTGIIGEGWKLVPSVKPTEASDVKKLVIHRHERKNWKNVWVKGLIYMSKFCK